MRVLSNWILTPEIAKNGKKERKSEKSAFSW